MLLRFLQLSHTVVLKSVSRYLLSIFLTLVLPAVVLPATATSAEVGFCSHLFSARSSKTNLEKSIEQNNSIQKWHPLFDQIKTHADLLSILNRIEIDYQYLTKSDIEVLQNINLISIVKKLRPSDIQKLSQFVFELVKRVDSKEKHSPLADWLYPMQFYFAPEKVLDFVEKVKPMSFANISFQEAFSGRLGLWGLNETFSAAVENLPNNIKLDLIKLLRKKIREISLDSELMSMNGSDLYVPSQRLYRRNLEVLIFLLTKKDVDLLKSNISRDLSKGNINKALNTYFTVLGDIIGPVRGGYSADIVIKSARIIQSQFFKHLTDSKLDYIDLYGSFPNGKATFKTSDIDIKFSDALLERLTGLSHLQIISEKFSLYFADAVTRNLPRLSEKFINFWNSYKTAETELAKNIFQRKIEKDSELLTSLFPPRDYSNSKIDFRWYNPLLIRIFRDKITLQIFDLSNSNPSVVELDIP